MLQAKTEPLIQAFGEIISCVENVYLWHYDFDFQYIESSCADSVFWNMILQNTPAKTDIQKYCRQNTRPILFGDETGLLWIAAPRHAVPNQAQSGLSDIYVLGPVFPSLQSENKMRQDIRRHEVSIAFQQEFIRHMKALPAISSAMFFFFGKMLHYCLTKERIQHMDIPVHTSGMPPVVEPANSEVSKTEFHTRAIHEEVILHLIKEGNLNYRSVLDRFPLNYGHVGMLAQDDGLRQAKNQFIAAATLYSRAAVQGGLSRVVSFSLANQYIRALEDASTIPETMDVYQRMLDDYIRRVHACKQREASSPLIRNCIELINLHIEKPLSLRWIAEQVNYSEYYLSKLFKKETGGSIVDYIKKKKIDYAKILLLDTNRSIQDIAEDLSFSTPSRFTETFRKITGIPPKEYRKRQTDSSSKS